MVFHNIFRMKRKHQATRKENRSGETSENNKLYYFDKQNFVVVVRKESINPRRKKIYGACSSDFIQFLCESDQNLSAQTTHGADQASD